MEALRQGDPHQVGRYTLLRRLGAGGMGVVYLGRSPAGRLVAVKVIRERFASDDRFVARFRREVTAARLVDGAFTAPVLDADPNASAPWLVTSYLPGISLREAIQAHGALPAGSVWTLAAGVAEALAEIHLADVVHRDVKPSNIMLTNDGPRVIDFGIARPEDATSITRLGAVLGSPGYMSPEQATGEPAEPASDVFSLGSVLVFAATAREPFGSGESHDVLRRVARVEVDLTGITDRALRELIASCLRPDPARRPSVAELLDRLHRGRPAARREPLPAPLVELIDHRARQARRLEQRGDATSVSSADPTLDPDLDHPSAADPTVPDVPPKLSRRLLLGAALVAAAGTGVGAVALGRAPAVAGRPRPATAATTPASTVPRRRWRVRVSTEQTRLHVVGGVLLAAARSGGVRALAPETGELVWSRDLETVESFDATQVYLVNPRGGQLSAIHAATGATRWTYDAPLGESTTPVVAAGPVVCCGNGTTHALGVTDGTPRWDAEISTFRGYEATADAFVASGTEAVLGFDAASGRQRWSVAIHEPADTQGAHGVFYLTEFTGTITAVRADTGAIAWQQPGLGTSAAIFFQASGDTAFCSMDGEIRAIDAAGQPRWTLPVGTRTGATDPYRNTDRCVLGLAGRTLFAMGVDKTMYAIDAAVGRIRWVHDTERRIVASPVGTAGLVFVATSDGYVDALEPPKGA